MNNRHIKCIVDHRLYSNTMEWKHILGGFSVSDLVPPTVEPVTVEKTDADWEAKQCTSTTSEIEDKVYKEDCRFIGDTARGNSINIPAQLNNEDLPNEVYLRYTNLCGYIAPNGKYYHCDSCEHTTIVRDIALGEYLEEYKTVPVEFFDEKPHFMLQEEYFLMKKLGFAKISSFKLAVDKMYLFLYGTLTPEQTDIIYPR